MKMKRKKKLNPTKVPKEVEFKSLRDTKELAAPRPESMRISEEPKSEDQDPSKGLKEAESEEKKSPEVSADQTDEVEKKDATSVKDLPQESTKKAENQTLDGAVEQKQELINESNDTISNNSKETSSCEIVDIRASEESIKKETSECSDWVEDFGSDIEMSEDEINKINESIQQDDNIGDDWENWESNSSVVT